MENKTSLKLQIGPFKSLKMIFPPLFLGIFKLLKLCFPSVMCQESAGSFANNFESRHSETAASE